MRLECGNLISKTGAFANSFMKKVGLLPILLLDGFFTIPNIVVGKGMSYKIRDIVVLWSQFQPPLDGALRKS